MADLKSCRVLVTPRSFGQSDPGLKTELESRVGEVVYSPGEQPLSSDALRDLLAGCDGYIAGLDNIDRRALEGASRLRVIARYGVGVDKVDLETARAMGIVVTNTPDANSVSVAELTIGLMLSLARHIPTAAAATRSGQWPRYRGLALEGKTVGLLGLGMIGRQVARRLLGFDCAIVAHDPAPDAAFAAAHHVELLPPEEVVARADFLSLHLPLLPATRCMVDAGFIGRMKRGAYLINTSRGGLLDEAALFDALQHGHLAGAALDVFDEEPPSPDNPLLALPQVIATPHMGAHSDSATNAMGRAALRDCLAVLSGQEPVYRVI
jgi:phosphoglycerate dehydrogenase-like enzyme